MECVEGGGGLKENKDQSHQGITLYLSFDYPCVKVIPSKKFTRRSTTEKKGYLRIY